MRAKITIRHPKRRQIRRCIQPLYAEELSEKQPPESYYINLDNTENGKSNEKDDIEKKVLIKQKRNNIFTSRLTLTKPTMFYPLKAVKKVILIENDDE